jgi:hypothetical protein
MLRKSFASAVVLSLIVNPAAAQIAVIDDANLDKRESDEKNTDTSVSTKKDEMQSRKSVVCTYTGKYRSEMFARSPAAAMERDAANVSMIRYYAKKYGISEGLALSVAYQESRFDSCAGSHTGVKGVMQLTKRTGAGMGFDRDINEQNIEGGVKYLAAGVDKCGESNYSCLASWYNGSNAAEQRGWAGGVGRFHGYFNSYVSTGQAPAAAPPAISIATISDAGGSAQSGALGSVSSAAANLNTSSSMVGRNVSIIDGLADSIGGTIEYKDAWELNSSARGVNTSVFNQYLSSSSDMTRLLGELINLRNTQMSQAQKTVTVPVKEKPNPFSCDPEELTKQKIPVSQWLPCAVEKSTPTASDQ